MTRASVDALREHLARIELIDHHVHGRWAADGDAARLAAALNEADTDPVTAARHGWDTQLGFAVRTRCAPLLDLPRHAAAEYCTRRAELGEDEVARRFLSAAGVSTWLVDTGVDAGLAAPDDLAALGGGVAREIVRLEEVAEAAAAAPGPYVEEFVDILRRRTTEAVATKTVIAYRGGFAGDLSDPPARLVELAADRWRSERGTRLTDRLLLRFGVHRALELGLPLQFHVGFGDRDARLSQTDPLLLDEFIRGAGDVPIMLLHCYPFERRAGYLAQAFPSVHLDGGLSIHHLGARSAAFVGRLLEMAPFTKLLYSSDGCGPAEFHFLGAALWRDGMASVLSGFVDDGEWSLDDAIAVADLVAHGNARRVYDL
ncbi:amidohydrolase family protein [Williamsia deligens]|uniref:Amidohydrolase family protein n=1 Tax=Williamsia deligens TaxID=321325 RepID=A0ABW3G3T7_9NOCA|nr:amidohydrolase family protein [Williamsia deligens]